MLDSGAFSAWAQKTEISLDEYIQFIHDMKGRYEFYVNLDDIESPEKSWENQKEMERQGLDPLPVYHYGESMKFLHNLMDDYEYFGVGGVALRKSAQVRTAFFDEIFNLLCTKKTDYLPTHKVHGFGMTSLNIVLRYPWYSVDSTSWFNAGRMGEVIVPRRRNGEWVYDDSSYRVLASSQSTRRVSSGRDVGAYPSEVQRIIYGYFESKGYVIGKSKFRNVRRGYELGENERWADDTGEKDRRGRVERIIERGLCNDYRLREEINMQYFLDFIDSMPDYPWQFRTKVRRLGEG
jgi:hypothetical protein